MSPLRQCRFCKGFFIAEKDSLLLCSDTCRQGHKRAQAKEYNSRYGARDKRPVLEKRCSECGKVYPAAFFPKRKEAPDGLRATCKTCYRQKQVQWYRAFRAAHPDYYLRWREAHPDYFTQYNRIRYPLRLDYAWNEDPHLSRRLEYRLCQERKRRAEEIAEAKEFVARLTSILSPEEKRLLARLAESPEAALTGAEEDLLVKVRSAAKQISGSATRSVERERGAGACAYTPRASSPTRS